MEVISEQEYEQLCRLADGREVRISIDDMGHEITVTTADGKKVGKIELDESDDGTFRLVWMFLDQDGGHYKRQGIGRQALRFHQQIFGGMFTATEDDGIRRSDGSHLTGDAPGFVRKLQQEGLILGGVNNDESES